MAYILNLLGTVAVLATTSAVHAQDCPYKGASVDTATMTKNVSVVLFDAPAAAPIRIASAPAISNTSPHSAIVSAPSRAFADTHNAELPAVDIAPSPIRALSTATNQAAPVAVIKVAQAPQSGAETMMKSELSPAASAYNTVLGNRISAAAGGLNAFDYAGAKAAGEADIVAAYIAELETLNPDIMSDNEAIAFWANLYNAVTVKVILDNYPVKSIREIKSGIRSGPWKRDLVTINGRPTSLDDIEHGILRKQFPSPLIHYMVNCASIGCPNLKNSLWDAKTLDSERDQAARDFVNSPRGAKITAKGIEVSSIYRWFAGDFGGYKGGVRTHLMQYAGPELKAALDGGAKITGHGYNWSLNE